MATQCPRDHLRGSSGLYAIDSMAKLCLCRVERGFGGQCAAQCVPLAEGLPPAQRAMLEAQTRAYVTAVLYDDWPAIGRGEIPEKSHHFNESMWQNVLDAASQLTTRSKVMAALVSEHKLLIVGAVHDVSTGAVNWLGGQTA
jgi:hypothetical protein